jgi:hypothetical protein
MPMNMSYCQFENTLAAMRECYQNMPRVPSDLSSDQERKAYVKFIELCETIAEEFAGN